MKYSNLKDSEAQELIRQKIRALKDNGHLPKGYAKVIREKYPEISIDVIYNAANGKPASEKVQNAIIELALENKAAKKLELLDSILEPERSDS